MKQLIFYILYYGFAQWLPAGYAPLGAVWRKIRSFVAAQCFAKAGKNINVESRAYFHSGKNIEIGNNSGIGTRAFLSGKVTIGDNVMMGPNVIIWTKEHKFDRTDIPMNQQGFVEEQPVFIGNDVWIGFNVSIAPGVKIGNGVVIGAGSMVTKDIPDWAVAVGNPAKVIRYRNEQK